MIYQLQSMTHHFVCLSEKRRNPYGPVCIFRKLMKFSKWQPLIRKTSLWFLCVRFAFLFTTDSLPNIFWSVIKLPLRKRGQFSGTHVTCRITTGLNFFISGSCLHQKWHQLVVVTPPFIKMMMFQFLSTIQLCYWCSFSEKWPTQKWCFGWFRNNPQNYATLRNKK